METIVKKPFTILFLVLFLASPCFGDSVIHVGELEVQGEVRRPMVEWVDSTQNLKQLIPIFLRDEFIKFEKEMTRLNPQLERVRDE